LGNISSNVLISETKFSVTFPKYQEKYIKECWKIIYRILKSYFIESILDISKGLITISTTNLIKDPFVIIKARAFLLLMSRSVPLQQAAKIFDDNISFEIIKLTSFIRSKKIFLKRRKKLIGLNGSIIRAIEMVTQTYLLVQGNTVSCMGTHSGIKQSRKIIEDCMKNIHPIFHIKILMIKQELNKDLTLKKKSWDKYIPLLKKKKRFLDKGIKLFDNKSKKKEMKKILNKNQLKFHEKHSPEIQKIKNTIKFEKYFGQSYKFLNSKSMIR
jgi:ribosomal RNA assembly protein